MILPLPDDDDALILRSESPLYGGPKPSTLARWASRPTDAPVSMPYTFVGKQAAYTVATFRKMREALTVNHAAERFNRKRKHGPQRSVSLNQVDNNRD